jgi:hypothetical protein
LTPDFDDLVVMRNTARVLRMTVLPVIDDPAVRTTVIQLIAVLERQVDPDHRSAADPRTVEGLDARLLGDSGVMSAFRGRLSPP